MSMMIQGPDPRLIRARIQPRNRHVARFGMPRIARRAHGVPQRPALGSRRAAIGSARCLQLCALLVAVCISGGATSAILLINSIKFCPTISSKFAQCPLQEPLLIRHSPPRTAGPPLWHRPSRLPQRLPWRACPARLVPPFEPFAFPIRVPCLPNEQQVETLVHRVRA